MRKKGGSVKIVYFRVIQSFEPSLDKRKSRSEGLQDLNNNNQTVVKTSKMDIPQFTNMSLNNFSANY